MSAVLLYTKEEVEDILKKMAKYMHNRNPNSFHPLFKDMNLSGFSFVSVTWNKVQGSYYGTPFMFYARENFITDEFEYKINW